MDTFALNSKGSKIHITYAGLIALALHTSETGALRTAQIYSFVRRGLPFVQSKSTKGFENSVRHNLSMRTSFYQESGANGSFAWNHDSPHPEHRPGLGGLWRLRDTDKLPVHGRRLLELYQHLERTTQMEVDDFFTAMHLTLVAGTAGAQKARSGIPIIHHPDGTTELATRPSTTSKFIAAAMVDSTIPPPPPTAAAAAAAGLSKRSNSNSSTASSASSASLSASASSAKASSAMARSPPHQPLGEASNAASPSASSTSSASAASHHGTEHRSKKSKSKSKKQHKRKHRHRSPEQRNTTTTSSSSSTAVTATNFQPDHLHTKHSHHHHHHQHQHQGQGVALLEDHDGPSSGSRSSPNDSPLMHHRNPNSLSSTDAHSPPQSMPHLTATSPAGISNASAVTTPSTAAPHSHVFPTLPMFSQALMNPQFQHMLMLQQQQQQQQRGAKMPGGMRFSAPFDAQAMAMTEEHGGALPTKRAKVAHHRQHQHRRPSEEHPGQQSHAGSDEDDASQNSSRPSSATGRMTAAPSQLPPLPQQQQQQQQQQPQTLPVSGDLSKAMPFGSNMSAPSQYLASFSHNFAPNMLMYNTAVSQAAPVAPSTHARTAFTH
ncbi:hypothetical protein PTSG_06836 [Salpingoeca rosetta]|uniref:Fork-head domain-containing protein n=1 Tax=Salpingoeca rosetta (strain ATCC 50818 / BSB-021) TaxID=946362 RepID=F2UEY3_SALR5|nr:uncharacterized protein PTSG_06836 [Salpingoeca rosetta]EGD75183.1 hypothetical protein PTSG_06836 [Salpingoeca rosetta]|eukprot:XP_004992236.1 hypothetical protein PTSG_06836 [Salpingoeca rosetta]